MMIDLFSALFGGVLVGGGMYVGAQIANVLSPRVPREPRAPRITREPRVAREPIAHSPESREQRKRQAIPIVPTYAETDASKRLGNDVVRALVTSGFGKAEAADAVAACSLSERSTIEAWLRAALKKLNTREVAA